MATLEYTFTNDTLFHILFVRYQGLLKRLVAKMLGIRLESIGDFAIANPEIPPEVIDEKHCRLDINMRVDGRRVDLEVQVSNEGDYPERSLYYWAREYSSALGIGEEYSDLPQTIVISIVAFKLFECEEFQSEYRALEVARHTELTDRFCLQYYELPKVPRAVGAEDELKLWLALFSAKTEEDLEKIEALEVPVMKQAIEAYRAVTAADDFREIERLRSRARHNEASALGHARREGYREADEKWQGVVAEKDAALSDQAKALAEKDAALSEKDATIAQLRAQLKST